MNEFVWKCVSAENSEGEMLGSSLSSIQHIVKRHAQAHTRTHQHTRLLKCNPTQILDNASGREMSSGIA